VFAYRQRLHRDLVNEGGRSVLYVMCYARLCLPSRQKQMARPVCRDAEWKSGDLQPQCAFIELFFFFCGGSVEGCHILLADAGEFSYLYLADLFGLGGGRGRRVFCSLSVRRPVAPRQYSSLWLTIIWIHTDWSQFPSSRVGKVRQWLQARNSPLWGTLFRS